MNWTLLSLQEKCFGIRIFNYKWIRLRLSWFRRWLWVLTGVVQAYSNTQSRLRKPDILGSIQNRYLLVLTILLLTFVDTVFGVVSACFSFYFIKYNVLIDCIYRKSIRASYRNNHRLLIEAIMMMSELDSLLKLNLGGRCRFSLLFDGSHYCLAY
jgi:hypothetical protein